jgi:Cu/Ag efflux protein CusF
MPRRLSGLQKDVLSLYRTILRACVEKDRAVLSEGSPAASFVNLLAGGNGTTPTTCSYAKSEFRKQAGQVKLSDFKTIEHKIRHGHKQVKLLKMPGVKVARGV